MFPFGFLFIADRIVSTIISHATDIVAPLVSYYEYIRSVSTSIPVVAPIKNLSVASSILNSMSITVDGILYF